MSKKMNLNWLWIVLIVGVVGGALWQFGVLDGLDFGLEESKLCTDAQYNYKCVCGANQMKVKDGLFSWKCSDMPDIPSDVTYPIESWEEAISFAESQMGGFVCNGEYYYDNDLSGGLPLTCEKYGATMIAGANTYKGHSVTLECLKITDTENGITSSGIVGWRLSFDPNDGYIYELSCSPNVIDVCPETTGHHNRPDAITVCGDGCCHSDEQHNNCPEDCEETFETCSSESLMSWMGSTEDYCDLCLAMGHDGNVHPVNGCPTNGGFGEWTDYGFDCDYTQYNCAKDGVLLFSYQQDRECDWSFVSINALESEYPSIC